MNTWSKKKLHDNEWIRYSVLFSCIILIPQILVINIQNPLFIFYNLIYHFIICIITFWIGQIAIKKTSQKKYTIYFLLVICNVLILSTLRYFHEGIIQNLLSIGYPYQKELFIISNLSFTRKILLSLFSSIFFIGIIHYIVYNQINKKEKQQANLEIEHLKQENLETRLKLLKQQISPHFLFNSLSTLRSIATDNKTKNYIIQLSNVYRYLLTNKGYKEENLVALNEELAFTKSYLYILNERFEDGLAVSISITEALMQKRLPPLALQILIENSIKHNIVSIEEPLHIEICNENDNTLIVKNNLQPKLSTEESFGMGLENIKDRYHLLDNKTIEIIQTEQEFIVKIPLL